MPSVLAAVGDGAGAFAIQQIEVSAPGPGEVRVDVKASGLCHTDWDGLTFTGTPHVMGHEGAGVVAEIAPSVAGLQVGQPVLLTWAIACGDCFQCQRGNETLCEILGRAGGRASAGSTRDGSGNDLARFFNLGTLSASTVVRQEAVVPLPAGIPFASACLLGCSVMTGYGSVINAAHVEADSTVAVIGCGGVGLNVIQGARIAGARQIVAVDVDASRLEGARRFGATGVVTAAREDSGLRAAAARVASMLGGRGADYAFECTGVPALGAAPLSFVRNGGTAIQVSGVEQEITVDMELFEWDKVYLNPLYGKCRPKVDFPILLDLYAKGDLMLDELVTRTYSLSGLDQAFDDLRHGRNAKGVICFD